MLLILNYGTRMIRSLKERDGQRSLSNICLFGCFVTVMLKSILNFHLSGSNEGSVESERWRNIRFYITP